MNSLKIYFPMILFDSSIIKNHKEISWLVLERFRNARLLFIPSAEEKVRRDGRIFEPKIQPFIFLYLLLSRENAP